MQQANRSSCDSFKNSAQNAWLLYTQVQDLVLLLDKTFQKHLAIDKLIQCFRIFIQNNISGDMRYFQGWLSKNWCALFAVQPTNVIGNRDGWRCSAAHSDAIRCKDASPLLLLVFLWRCISPRLTLSDHLDLFCSFLFDRASISALLVIPVCTAAPSPFRGQIAPFEFRSCKCI